MDQSEIVTLKQQKTPATFFSTLPGALGHPMPWQSLQWQKKTCFDAGFSFALGGLDHIHISGFDWGA